jgi:hypothetical protein
MRAHRVSVGTLAVCVIAAIILGLVTVERRNARLEALTKRVNELQSEARARNVPRSVLHGRPLPGNAWDEYTIAINEATSWTEDPNGRNLGHFLNDDPETDRALVDRMLASHAAVLDHLRAGAQRLNGQHPYQWERAEKMQMPSLAGARILSRLALAQSKVLLERGRTQEALDLLLDKLVFARDLRANGPLLATLIGDAVYSLTFDEFKRLIASGKLTPAQLADLENKLEIADRDFPSLMTTMTNENLSLGMAVLNGEGSGGSMAEWMAVAVQGGWRYGFSPRYMAADAFQERESHLRRAQIADSRGAAEVRKEARAIEAEAVASTNPVVQMIMPSFARSDEAHRDTLTRLRLLRAAIGLLRTGTVPQVDDPFGSSLLHSQSGGKTRIWSVGTNGTDDGGLDGWTARRADVVLEMQK